MAQQPNDLPVRPEPPDALTMLDGTKVASTDDWKTKRRPEIERLFATHVYGSFPARPDNVAFKVDCVDPKALGGKATIKEVTISYGLPETPKIHLLLVIPNKRSGPAPVFVGLNFYGNHSVLDDANIRLPTGWVDGGRKGVVKNRATDAGRGSALDRWAIEQTIDAGFAVATVYYGDIVSDRSDVQEGIQKHFKTDVPWGAITAWAFGLQRVVDYLVADPDFDASKIIAVGHSRLGKTALLAAAFDSRVAMVVSNQSGCGGAAPSRTTNPKAETIVRITSRFPHWFTPAFARFGKNVERLPVDQHLLIALIAPRPVLLNNAIEDQWADPDGQFRMLQLADPVYKLLGSEGLRAKSRPAVGEASFGPLSYSIREGKHSVTPADWRTFVEFVRKNG